MRLVIVPLRAPPLIVIAAEELILLAPGAAPGADEAAAPRRIQFPEAHFARPEASPDRVLQGIEEDNVLPRGDSCAARRAAHNTGGLHPVPEAPVIASIPALYRPELLLIVHRIPQKT